MRRGLGGPLPWLGALVVAYLAFPLAAFFYRVAQTTNRGFGAAGLWGALGVSIEGATISLVLLTVTGIPLAYVLVRHRGRLASFVGIIVQIPLALPPLMSGILLVYVVGPYSTLGRHFDGDLTESLTGVVIAQSFVSAPFLVIAARSAFATVDPALGDLAATLGHRPIARFFHIDLRCAAAGIRAGMVLTWLRAFGEYGATQIIAYHPFSLPIYTYNQFETYPLSTTEAPTLLALAVAVAVVCLGQTRVRIRFPHKALPAPMPPPLRSPTPVGFGIDTTVGTFQLQVTHPSGASRLAIVGPSGSGKSLTLRVVAGLVGRQAGTVTYAGADVSALVPERRRIGYVPQGLGLIPGLTVRRQILFGVHADKARAAWWIATLHLDELLDRYPHQLSGGQSQRVSLARALACDPDVLLLDEPLSALDAPVRDELRRELRRLQRQTGLSTVLVTHDPREAAFLADEIVVISAGAVLQSGRVTDIYRRPNSPEIGRLLGIDNLRHGVVQADGSVLADAIRLPLTTGFTAGQAVLWSIPPEQVVVTSAAQSDAAVLAADSAAGGYSGVVLDVIDIGVAFEVTVRLDGGPQLRSRRSQLSSQPTIGEACHVQLDPTAISAWVA